jgi:two-component system LytT family response regulator
MKAKKILAGRPAGESRPETGHFFVKSEGRDVRINVEDIEYIESLSEYVRIHRTGQPPVMSLMRLKNLEETLPPQSFMRVHRSYIVNLAKIQTVERNRIIFGGKVYIPVSEQYRERLRGFLDGGWVGS